MVGSKKNMKINNELKNKTILLTGGAGSIGSMLTKKLLEFLDDEDDVQRVYSNFREED